MEFLPSIDMLALAKGKATCYQTAQPFPHIILDNFFDPAVLDQVLTEFPAPDAPHWKKYQRDEEIKLALQHEKDLGEITRLLIYHLNSAPFIDFLSSLTGIPHLIPDPYLEGGGLHQIKPGGKLAIHADFNKHKKYGLDRRLNLLVYLNKDWQSDFGGCLELWDREMKACQTKILPIFNRVVVFSTTDFTYHGHPDPLTCPLDRTRKSLALYYYSNGRPASEIGEKHTTLFKERPGETFKPVKKSWWKRFRDRT